jgi:hypothetical protein
MVLRGVFKEDELLRVRDTISKLRESQLEKVKGEDPRARRLLSRLLSSS